MQACDLQKPYQPYRVLLLGASGKLGRIVQAVYAHDQGAEISITPVARRSCGLAGALYWHPGEDMAHLPQCDGVLALWGVTQGGQDALAQNSALAIKAEQVARQTGASCVIHCSSAAIYRPARHSLTEEAPVDPPSAYGRAKLHMEQVIKSMRDDLRHVVLRIGNVAGAESLFGNMRSGKPVVLDQFENGQGPERSYISPQDLARVFIALLHDETARGVYNVAAPDPVRMQDLAKAAGCEVIWRRAPIHAVQSVILDTSCLARHVPLAAPSSDPATLVACAQKAGIWP